MIQKSLISKSLALIAGAALLLSLGGCGQVVQPGEVGIKIKNYGSDAGVQQEPLQTGWNAVGLGERIEFYPVIEKYYPFSKSADEGNGRDESIYFADKSGAPVSGDVNIKLNVIPAKAPSIYLTYRLDFQDLLDGPIRNDVRSAIAREAEAYAADEMPGPNRDKIVQAALVDVQKKWSPQGVNISDLAWLGSLHYPPAMENSINAKIAAQAQVAQAQAEQAVAEAQAKIKVATAQGDADAARIRGQALEANPAVLHQLMLERWDGHLPTYMGSGAPLPILSEK